MDVYKSDGKKQAGLFFLKYMAFSLNEEIYGIDILKIKGIIQLPHITPVPRMPAFIKGVINLRGRIVPVVDMRLKIGFEPREYDERTCIIVTEISMDRETILLGLIVDRVLEVLKISGDQMEPSPNFGFRIDTSFILGMAKVQNMVVALLDIENFLTANEMTQVRANTTPAPQAEGDAHV